MNLSVKRVLKFTLLPGIVPLLRDLFAAGFGQIAFFMAQIYGAVRLLPPNHPYLNPANMGRFGLRHVIAAAAGNLKFKRENIDQVIIFVTLLAGLVILFMQFLLLGLSFFMHRAHADSGLPTSFSGFFGTTNNTTDVAFILMDRVFGVPGVFNSCVAQMQPCLPNLNLNPDGSTNAVSEGQFPWPFHKALQSVFGFYSYGLLVIALIIFLYYVIAVVAETAQTGTPFGQRFSKVWAPIRMVVALGLLIPVANGLNSAQYIVLYAAKWGSGFATNGWLTFANQAMPQSGQVAKMGNDRLFATPNPPELTNLLEYNTVLQTCWAANGRMKTKNPQEIQAYFVGDSSGPGDREVIMNDTTYQEALDFYKGHDVRIVFGSCQMQDSDGNKIDCGETDDGGQPEDYTPVYAGRPGGVEPICGEIDMQTANADDPGANAIQSHYFEMVRDMWMGDASPAARNAAQKEQDYTIQQLSKSPEVSMQAWGDRLVDIYLDSKKLPNAAIPGQKDAEALHKGFDDKIQQYIQDGVQAENNANFYANAQTLGWAGAAIWYNKIAQTNGALVTAASKLPSVVHYPQVMEAVREAKAQSNSSSGGREVFAPYLADGSPLPESEENSTQIAKVLKNAYDLWEEEYPKPSGDVIKDFVKNLFGVRGLFDMQNQVDVQPLAQLAMLGKTLVERGIDCLVAGGAGALGGGIASYFGYNTIPALVQQFSSIVVQLGVLAITAGFLLFYAIPFLPFLYFFFAISTWVKGIFEAMVGVPLWALAHIRIDGDNLQGPAAGAGYLMLLEIFLRPILIVFGLLAAVILFSAEVHVLQNIWSLVVTNVSGFNMAAATNATGGASSTAPAPGQTGSLTQFRGAIDQFFYTIIYAIVVYMMGSASFKLIFLLPNSMMRWLGHGNVQAFNDDGAQIAEHVMRKMQIGADRITSLSSGTVSKVTEIGDKMRTANNVAAARKKQGQEVQQAVLADRQTRGRS